MLNIQWIKVGGWLVLLPHSKNVPSSIPESGTVKVANSTHAQKAYSTATLNQDVVATTNGITFQNMER